MELLEVIRRLMASILLVEAERNQLQAELDALKSKDKNP